MNPLKKLYTHLIIKGKLTIDQLEIESGYSFPQNIGLPNQILVTNGLGLTEWKSISSIINTDDIPEGSYNKYFTEEKVDDRISSLIIDSQTVIWNYDDSLNTLKAEAITKLEIKKNSISIGSTGTLNFIQGQGILIDINEDNILNKIDILIKSNSINTIKLDGNQIGDSDIQTLNFDPIFTVVETSDTLIDIGFNLNDTNFINTIDSIVNNIFSNKTTDDLLEGNNLYFTNNRAINSVLTGYSPSYGQIYPTDSIIQAIQKLEGNINLISSSYVSSVNNEIGNVIINIEGTLNRIVVSGGSSTNPIIDISNNYEGQTSITKLGTITIGEWNANIISGEYGGTGVNNFGKTITLGGNIQTIGPYDLILNLIGNTNITLPSSGVICTLSGIETLTNKTINGLFNSISNISLSTSVIGVLPISNGGTGQNNAQAAFNALSPLNSKGDILTNDGTNNIKIPVGINGQTLVCDSSKPGGIRWSGKVFSQILPTDPTPTTSLLGVMMGLGIVISPKKTGDILIILSGNLDNITNNRGAQIQIRIGTGTPPSNGSSLTGTPVGNISRMFQTNASIIFPSTCNAAVSGLTIGASYWIDISLAAISGGTARIRDISVSIVEI